MRQYRVMTRKPHRVHMVRWDGEGFDTLEEFRGLVDQLHLAVDGGASTETRYVAHLNGIMYLVYDVPHRRLVVSGPRDRSPGRSPVYGDWICSCPEIDAILLSDATSAMHDYDEIDGATGS